MDLIMVSQTIVSQWFHKTCNMLPIIDQFEMKSRSVYHSPK